MGHSYRNGFSMIEVLVSILVLALGVIGAAGMQLHALRTNQQSGFQSAAVQLASELADKMRANDSQMRQDDSANPFLAIDYHADAEPQQPSKLCFAEGCDPAELADFDIYEWEKRVKAALPDGRVLVCRDTEPWDSTKHSLSWACKSGAGGGSVFLIKIGWQGKNPDGTLIRDADKQFAPVVALAVEPYIR